MKTKNYFYLSLLLLGLLFTVASCSKSSTKDHPTPTPDGETIATSIAESSATHKGVIVGSTGYFYAKIAKSKQPTLDEMKLSVVLDGVKTDLQYNGRAIQGGTDTTVTFGSGSKLIKLLFKRDATTVPEIVWAGHDSIAAYVVKYDQAKPNNEKALVLEGTATTYIYLRDKDKPAQILDPKNLDENTRLVLGKQTLNVVVEGGKGEKMRTMSRIFSTPEDTAIYQKAFAEKGARYPDYKEFMKNSKEISKRVYNIVNRSNTELQVQSLDLKETLKFSVVEKDGKQVLKIEEPASKNEEFKATVESNKLKQFHIAYSNGTAITYYNLKDKETYDAYTSITTGSAGQKTALDVAVADKKAEIVAKKEDAESTVKEFAKVPAYLKTETVLYAR